jgi:hypothetical protein
MLHHRSRYPPDSGGDSRRSPRDRSPNRYNDQRDSNQFNASSRGMDNQYRSSSDARASSNGFQSGRDGFRDSGRESREFSNREPPRGPKALTETPPSGPRASNFPSEFIRGRGRARARGWRDSSRDRGRDLDRDFRESRDDRGPRFRDSNDRGRDRDWGDRGDRLDRERRDSFRTRRPSPGRPRSPIRNDSRDIIRGRGRGRGDGWEPRGRGRGPYFEESRGRGRSRSPERERIWDKRQSDSREPSYPQRVNSIAVPSLQREHQSPPPQAPEVPAFGSVVQLPGSRQASPPAQHSIPTGPRAIQTAARTSTSLVTHPTPTVALLESKQAESMQLQSLDTKDESTAVSPTKMAPSIEQERSLLQEPSALESPVASPPKAPETPVVDNDVSLIRKQLTDYSTPEEDVSDSDIDVDFEIETKKVEEELTRAMLSNTLKVFVSTSVAFNKESDLQSPVVPATPVEPPAEGKDAATTPEIQQTGQASESLMTPAVSPPATSALPSGASSTTAIETAIFPSKPKLQIPADDDSGEETSIEELQALEAVRKKMKTPPVESLPYTPISPWYNDDMFSKSVQSDPEVMDLIVTSLNTKADLREREIEKLAKEYKRNYKAWILFHKSDDPLAVRCRERWESNRLAEMSRAASAAPAAEGRGEGRRQASRFATEHDIERVLKQSEMEAREHRERSDRAAKEKAASEKEAVIPNMLSKDERENTRYADYSNLVAPDRVIARFEVLGSIPNFTEWERETFEKVMLDHPKQWTKVAEALPGRNYKHCIQYYYLVKGELNLKAKLKKHTKGRRKGRKANPKTSVLTTTLEGKEGEEENGEGTGERRRPRRAAAPTFSFENAPSESDTSTPAASTGRRGAAAPKNETNTEQTTTGKRKKGAGVREKNAKQQKNNQLLAAAPKEAAKPREETKVPHPLPIKEWQQPQPQPPPEQRFISSWDGAPINPTPYAPPNVVHEKPPPPVAPSLAPNMEISPPNFAGQDRVENIPPNPAFDVQQADRRNVNAPTSSYWSVPEQTDFPQLLEHFGTDWHGIAKWMASKTHVMVYTTIFSQWLTVPSDSNKSRCVANLQQQVKNYYQRQVDSGKPEWEEIARIADEKKRLGESTGPPPVPVPLKRRYDGPTGSPHRPVGLGGMSDEIDDHFGQMNQQPGLRFSAPIQTRQFEALAPSSNRPGPPVSGFEDEKPMNAPSTPGQHASSPQPPGTMRYTPLAQYGPLSQTPIQPNRPTTLANKNPPAPPKQSRGPPLGFFNPDLKRPILQAAAPHPSQQSMAVPDPIRAQRSQMAAQEAQLERQQALRLEEQQQQARQQQIRMKQEAESKSLNHFEQYAPTQPQQPSNVPFSRPEPTSPIRQDDLRRAQLGHIQQYQPRTFQQPQPRNIVNEKINTGPSTPVTHPPPIASRTNMSAPPAPPQQAMNPHPAPPPPPVVRQGKTSSIMSLLNDEPSEPVAPKRAPDPQPAHIKPSPSPIPQPPQHIYQPSNRPLGPQHSHIRRESSLSDIRSEIRNEMRGEMRNDSRPDIRSDIRGDIRGDLHGDMRSDLRGEIRNDLRDMRGDIRSEMRPEVRADIRSDMRGEIRGDLRGDIRGDGRVDMRGDMRDIRNDNRGDLRGTLPSQPSHSASTSQGPLRHSEMPYPVPGSNQPPSQSRPMPPSSMEANAPLDRDYYSHPQQYLQRQQAAASSPQLGMAYQSPQPQQPQHQSHRSLAFGSSTLHPASPNLPYSHPSLHNSRHSSFDARTNLPTSAPPVSQSSTYSAPQHQGSSLSAPYQRETPQQHPLQPNRFANQQPPPSAPPSRAPLSQQLNPQPTHLVPQNQQIPSQHSYGQAPSHHLQHQTSTVPPQRTYTPSPYEPRGYPPPNPQEEVMIRRQQMHHREVYPGAQSDEAYQRELEERKMLEERRRYDERRFDDSRR